VSDSLPNLSQSDNTAKPRLLATSVASYTISRCPSPCEDHRVRQIALVYQEAFRGPPYFEYYDEAYVIDEIVVPHLPFYTGMAEVAGEIVGMVCAHPLSADLNADIRDYLLTQAQEHLSFSLDQAVYLSELAVLSKCRGAGIGTQLTQACLNWAWDSGYLWCVTRTAEHGSNSVRIFLRAGFQHLPFVQNVTSSEVKSSSERRIWLCRGTQQ